MDTKFTPGPWRVIDREVMEDDSVYPCHIVGGASEYEVCLLESPLVAGLRVNNPNEFPPLNNWQNANARLIAAAPTMYGYLEQKAADGDEEASAILGGIHANT